ncbi:ABC transporter ATP-binding protein [Sporosarcina sp. resist]|uniref:ABC transporter ATP-binding protein n=1 Tax=unclassified Sporosarcina TaxID=2647733 RepID=UPI00164D4962|nr:ABC transporter ATP-binding protein [Sporosarcina sp. resist]QNK89890.1 ABC transporter ATP-binding protein [Sporosarcina sp. resist]
MSQQDIQLQDIGISFGSKDVVTAFTATIKEGKITVLLGPNGCGKSTLLKAISNIVTPQTGKVLLGDTLISSLSAKNLAKKMALLPQVYDASIRITVEELVEQGRYPHMGAIGMLRKQDHIAIGKAMEMTSVNHLKNKLLDNLSGGERQRAWLALALAQDTPIILLDEPTTFLDIQHQLAMLELIKEINQKEQKTILLVLHDLNQALQYADEILLMKNGSLYIDGKPKKVLNAETIKDVYNVKVSLIEDAQSNKSFILPFH